VINFAKFRLDKMDQIDQYEEMLVCELDLKPASPLRRLSPHYFTNFAGGAA